MSFRQDAGRQGMGRLVSTAIGSLDGYLADPGGDFGWAAPDAEVHAFVNARMCGVGTYLYGRRTYALMTAWENDPGLAAGAPETAEFAGMWQRADKVVYSTSLPEVVTRRTALRRSFDADEVARLKRDAVGDLAVAGPTLARHAHAAGLVDELEVFLVPLVLGGGLSFWPPTRTPLVLRDERRFAGGVVWLRYDVVDAH
jgi:dihydrofolate reductase